MDQHFVTYLSPGTMFPETTSRAVNAWDAAKAAGAAHGIKERHGATPYGFYFTTRARKDDELDSREISRSHTYYLGGKIETLADIEARADPKEEILRSNMRANGWDKVLVNTNSYKVCLPLEAADVVLDWTPCPSPDAPRAHPQEVDR